MLALTNTATTVLIVVLVLLVFGALPGRGPVPAENWGRWGYAPSGLLGVAVVVLLILLLLGYI